MGRDAGCSRTRRASCHPAVGSHVAVVGRVGLHFGCAPAAAEAECLLGMSGGVHGIFSISSHSMHSSHCRRRSACCIYI